MEGEPRNQQLKNTVIFICKITNYKTITMKQSKFWVTMTDKFMSGWGKAQGMTNKMIIECDNYKQAQQIEQAANRRSEMKYVNICSKKPYYRSNVLVSERHFNDMGGVWLKGWNEPHPKLQTQD
jgi:hypothetical protein